MRELFRHYHPRSNEETAEAWRHGLFVFDTNVLLNLYKYPAKAREGILEAIAKLGDRAWLPFQAALEFHVNLASVRKKEGARIAEIQGGIRKLRATVQAEVGNLDLKKRHARLGGADFEGRVNALLEKAFEECDGEVVRALRADPNLAELDAIAESIYSIFEGRVGAVPTADEREALQREGTKRYEHLRPPGYMDSDKNDPPAYLFSGIRFERRFGDLAIWIAALDEVKRRELKYLVIVSDEQKDDWWDNARKIPRVELAEEAIEYGCRGLWMYTSQRFAQSADRHLSVKIRSEDVASIGEVAIAEQRLRDGNEAVDEWTQATAWGKRNRLREFFELSELGQDTRGLWPQLADRAPSGIAVPTTRAAIHALHRVLLRAAAEGPVLNAALLEEIRATAQRAAASILLISPADAVHDQAFPSLYEILVRTVELSGVVRESHKEHEPNRLTKGPERDLRNFETAAYGLVRSVAAIHSPRLSAS